MFVSLLRALPYLGRGAKGVKSTSVVTLNDMGPKVTSYAGLLDQSGFKEWYKYLKLRTMHRYDAEEVSFLMGKPPFYFQDYDMLAVRSKMTDEDQTALSEVFEGQRTEQMDFDKDEYGAFEKRIIRVRRTEDKAAINYLITVPWKIPGKSKTAKLKIREEKRIVNDKEEHDMRRKIGYVLDKLWSIGFFCCGQAPLDIYREVEERMEWSPTLRPKYVKQVLYQQINVGNLFLMTSQGQLCFNDRRLDLMQNTMK